MKLEFSQHILENSQVSDFMNIHLVGAELFHADGQKNRQTWRSWQSLFAFFPSASNYSAYLFILL